MKLPKIITDPSCKGCQKRKEWLVGAAHRTKKFMARTVEKGSNAARRVIKR